MKKHKNNGLELPAEGCVQGYPSEQVKYERFLRALWHSGFIQTLVTTESEVQFSLQTLQSEVEAFDGYNWPNRLRVESLARPESETIMPYWLRVVIPFKGLSSESYSVLAMETLDALSTTINSDYLLRVLESFGTHLGWEFCHGHSGWVVFYPVSRCLND